MGDNEIVELNPDGSVKRVRFKAVSAVMTPQAMEDLVNQYAEALKRLNVHPLISTFAKSLVAPLAELGRRV